MAVLLDNIMERLDKLEKRVNMVLENSTLNTRQLMQEGVQVKLFKSTQTLVILLKGLLYMVCM